MMFKTAFWIRDFDGEPASLFGNNLKDLANVVPLLFRDRLDSSFLNRSETALPADPPSDISAYFFGDGLDSTGFVMFLEQTVKVLRRERDCASRPGARQSFLCANAETACGTHYGDCARSYKVPSVHSVFETFAHDGRSFRVVDGSMKFTWLSSPADQI
jgi:hypothetical protein